MGTSEFETGRSKRTMVIAVVVIAIIGVSAVVIMIGFQPTGKSLTILTRHDTAIQAAYEDAFLATEYAQTNGITKIEWKNQQPGYWDDVIDAGGIDLLWGGGPTNFDLMVRGDYLVPLTSDLMTTVLARVPDEIAGADMKRRNTEGDVVWVSAAISSFGFTVNHDFLDDHSLPTPNNWTHLARPIWASLLPTATIAMGNAPTTTSNTRIYEVICQGMGWDAGWVTMARMAGSSRLYQSSVDTQAAVETGSVGVAMSIDFYGYSSMLRYPDCEYILPEGETIVNGDPIAIVTGTANQDLAEGFIDWLFTAEGQAIWFTEGVNRMPVLEDAFQTPTGLALPELYEFFNKTKANVGIDFNDTLSLAWNTAFISYFEAVFNDAHDKLTLAWEALVEAFYALQITEAQLDALATQMGTPVTVEVDGTPQKFTQEYAVSINDHMLSSSSFLHEMQVLWTTAANAQYDQVIVDLAALIGG